VPSAPRTLARVEARSTHSVTDSQKLLDAARAGDEGAFRRIVDAHHRELHVHCYRMLGSLHDAEDALQEALLRAWRALPRLESSDWLRAWLYKIATNVCLNTAARRARRVLPIDHGPPADPDRDPGEPLVESLWIEPYPDERVGVEAGPTVPEARYEQREAVELAFVAALQHLPPRQRAVLILRDVLGFSAREVAGLLDATVASVNSAMQRARQALDERLPDHSQQSVVHRLGDERIRDLVTRFADAFERGDVELIVDMLVEDATFAMPPYPAWYRGRDDIARSWLMPGGPLPRLRLVPTRACGQPALGFYRLDREAAGYLPIALDVLTLRGEHIAEVTAFRTPTLFRPFDLPDRLPA
jgi:RNA polymerase sigma-70 factor, ECF subfamily